MTATMTESSAQVLSAAIDLALEMGVAGVGARPLVTHKGVHRSAVNYHFGSRAALLELVHAELLERRRNALEMTIDELADQPRHLLSMPGFFAAVHAYFAQRLPGLDAFLVELYNHDDGAEPAIEECRVRDWHLRAELWTEAAKRLRCADHAACWLLAAEGLPEFSMLDSSALGIGIWVPDFAWRLDDRLARRVPRQRPLSPNDETYPRIEETAYSGSARAIIDGTVELLLSRKPITLRAIAAQTGVAISSIKYLFPQNKDLVGGAYRTIHQTVLEGKIPANNVEGALSMGSPFDDQGNFVGTSAALQTLSVLVKRNPDLDFLAEEMRSQRGSLAERSLVARGLVGADRLDGIIWSTLAIGTINEAVTKPPSDRRNWVARRAAELSELVFDEQ